MSFSLSPGVSYHDEPLFNLLVIELLILHRVTLFVATKESCWKCGARQNTGLKDCAQSAHSPEHTFFTTSLFIDKTLYRKNKKRAKNISTRYYSHNNSFWRESQSLTKCIEMNRLKNVEK
jgi:hypothetical protein